MRQRTDPVPSLSRVIMKIEEASRLLAAAAEELRAYADENVSHATRPSVGRVASARFVTVEFASALTGLSRRAIETKMYRRQWLEGRHWVKRDGRVLVDMQAYEAWASKGDG